MARNKKVEILSNDKEVLHPMTDGDCVIFEDGQTLTQKLSEDDSVKYTPEIVNSSPMFKVGEGNTVDYSDNVLDGAYERATLQGQTYVNHIQESSADEITLPTPFTEYERTQHNTLTSNEEGTLGINLVGQSYVNALQHDSEEEYVVLGESLEFQEKKVEYTSEGQIKSAMLKGQTLVNIVDRIEIKDAKTYCYLHLRHYKPQATYTYLIFNAPTNMTKIYLGQSDGTQLWCSWTSDFKRVGSTIIKTVVCPESQTLQYTLPHFEYSGDKPNSIDNLRIMLIEGDYSNMDIPYFEGIQSVTVSTKLENLCHKYNSELAKNGKTFNANSLSNRCLLLLDKNDSSIYSMKPNTKYLIQFKISNLVLDGLESIALRFYSSSEDCIFGQNAIVYVTSNGIYNAVFTTTDLVSTCSVEIKGLSTQWEDSGSTLRSLTISNIMYVEYQNGMENWDLPYFEDYQVMKPVQVESVNKNLYDVNKLTNMTTAAVKATVENSVVRIESIRDSGACYWTTLHGDTVLFKKGVTYILSYDYTTSNSDQNITCVDMETQVAFGKISTTDNGGKVITKYCLDKDTEACLRFYVAISADGKLGGVTTYSNIQLEESDTATEYVPHQSKTTYSWDEVILRKIGDVEDTLDLTTGEWVQRIGEVVFDGSDDENWDTNGSYPNGAMVYMCQNYTNARTSTILIQSDKLSTFKIVDNNETMEDKPERFFTRVSGTGKIQFISKTTFGSFVELRQWLQSNPLRVQYELTVPIVHKVNLSRPNLQVYDDITHVHTKCLDGTLVPNIYLPSDISYPAILEPNTTYNVSINHTEVNADNPLTVNVGGTEITMTDSRMTLTTPTTLANNNVSFTGKGNKIKESMLIKNSSLLTRDLPHFNGIGSVQLGKTIENLCGSSKYGAGTAQTLYTLTNDSITVNVKVAGTRLFGFDLLKPLENNKKYFIYAPQTYDDSLYKVSFKSSYNGSSTYSKQLQTLSKIGKTIIEIDQTDVPYSQIVVGIHTNISVNTTYTIQRPIICEYQQDMENWDWESIGYFTGTKNIGNEFMRVQNKNLFDSNNLVMGANQYWASQGYEVNIGHTLRATLSQLIQVTPGCTLTLTFGSNYQGVIQEYISSDKRTHYNDNGWQDDIHTLKLSEKTKYVNIYFRKKDDTQFTTDELNVLKNSIQLEESSTATTYTAHKHNGLYITKDQPINLTWEQGRINPSGVGDSYTNAINNAVSYGIRNKGLLNLKPNTTYRISLGDKANFKYHIAVFDNSDNALSAVSSLGTSGEWVSSRDTIFTTTKDAHKIGINVQKQDASSITPSEINHVRLEEVTDVVLRGIGDVHDELDITRGIYTQRISEIILDGSENWSSDINGSGATRFYNSLCNDMYIKYGTVSSSANLICNNFNHPIGNIYTDTNNSIQVVIPNGLYFICTECSTVEEWRTWLKNNKTIIQYALKTPIIHKVHIGNKNEVNTEVTKPNDVFTLPTLYTEQTHIDLTNNGVMPKVQSRDYVAYPVLPMVNRTYTLQHNLTGGVSNLTIDLLGRTQSVSYQNHKSLVYTPVTMDAILHHELRISGKGKISRVMYIDGGYMDRDIPYIEGMKNACNPVVKNVSKNLFDKTSTKYIGSWLSSSCAINKLDRIKLYYIPCLPNTTYTISKVLSKYFRAGTTNEIPTTSSTLLQVVIKDSSSEVLQITTVGSAKYLCFNVYDNSQDTLPEQTILDSVMLEQGLPTSYEPYKENICYVDCGEIRLTQDMFEEGNFGSDASKTYEENKTTATNRYRVKTLVKVEPNTTYNIRYTEHDSAVFEYGKDEKKLTLGYNINKSTLTITTSNDCYYLAFNFVTSTLPTQYISIIKVSEIKQMRSLPNGVHDEIDLETGKYIQRVGEVVFDGSDDEDWQLYIHHINETTLSNIECYNIPVPDMKVFWGTSYGMYCDKLKTRSYLGDSVEALYWGGEEYCIGRMNGHIGITINANLRLWLQENPITVQYELAEPIVKDIVINNYPHSYEDGHVIIENNDPNTPIPAQLTYRAVTNRSGQIQQHTEQVEKQEREINELETLILANIHLSQTR